MALHRDQRHRDQDPRKSRCSNGAAVASLVLSRIQCRVTSEAAIIRDIRPATNWMRENGRKVSAAPSIKSLPSFWQAPLSSQTLWQSYRAPCLITSASAGADPPARISLSAFSITARSAGL